MVIWNRPWPLGDHFISFSSVLHQFVIYSSSELHHLVTIWWLYGDYLVTNLWLSCHLDDEKNRGLSPKAHLSCWIYPYPIQVYVFNWHMFPNPALPPPSAQRAHRHPPTVIYPPNVGRIYPIHIHVISLCRNSIYWNFFDTVSNCPWCQIVRGVKLSAVSNCPVSNCPII